MSRRYAFARCDRWTLAVLTLLFLSLTPHAQQADEPPPTFAAGALLPANVLKGAHHRVAEPVKTETYFHEFTIDSDFGAFEAVGRSQLAIRIQEIEALAALQEVSKTEVFLSAAGRSVVNVGKGAAAAVTDPAATAKGMGAGIKRFGVNLGRRTQRAVEGVGESGGSPEGDAKDSAAAGAASSLLGVTAAMRRWAQKVNVDPYTTNRVLNQALADIGKVDAAGSIATKVVVPIPAAVGLTSSVGNLVWAKDPEEVRKINETRLKELGVADAVAKAFFKNPWLTLTYQTRLVAALHGVRVDGCADYVQTAAEARSEREALFHVESTEMLQEHHAGEPVSRLLTDSRALVALTRNGRAVALLPLDYVRSTSASSASLGEIQARSKQELGAAGVDVHLTGRASDRVMREFSSLTWTTARRLP